MDRGNTTVGAPPLARVGWQRFKSVPGYLLAAAGLAWVLHDVHFEDLGQHLASIQWGWVGLAVAADILNCFCQGLRWHFLLRPVAQVPVLKTTQAIYVGMFVNEILPMRFGELARAFLIARWKAMKFLAIVPSMVMERMLDGLWLVVGVGLMAFFVPLPKGILEAEEILGASILIVVVLVAYLVIWRQKPLADQTLEGKAGWKPLRLLKSFIGNLVEGIRHIGISHFLYLAAGASFCSFVFQVLSFWLVMWGYGLHLSFWSGAAVLLIIHLGIAIPNAPGNVGLYQFFCVLGLMVFGVDKTLATGFSVVVFFVLTTPLWIIGFFALSRSGTTLAAIRSGVVGMGMS